MSDYSDGFNRVNFFTGFQTTADDWNAVIDYDVGKHKLHNQLFHGPGVVGGISGELRVAARGRGDLSVEVSAGHAIDGSGNDIYLAKPEIKTISPADFKLPQTVYVVVKFVEELSDFVSYKANLEYKGHRRVSERIKIDAIITEPDITREVELARIHMTPGVKRITDAKDPDNPQNNEIDLRYVPLAGVVGSNLTPQRLRELAEIVEYASDVYAHLMHNMGILPAGDVLHALITFDMMRRVNLVDRRNVFELWGLVFQLQTRMIAWIEANQKDLSAKKGFDNFKKHVQLLLENYQQRKFNDEFLTNIIGYERKSSEHLFKVVGMKATKKKKKAVKKEASGEVYEKMKVHSDDFGETLTIDGFQFKRVDVVDVLNKKSEKDHKFKIVDAKDKYRTRQKLKYPDGVIVEDVGTAYEGGHCEFEINNIVPNKDLVMVMRMDYVHGGWEAEMDIGGKRVGKMICEGEDRKFRWRNWPFVFEAQYVTDTSLTIKQTPLTADRDINIFKLWFYQPA